MKTDAPVASREGPRSSGRDDPAVARNAASVSEIERQQDSSGWLDRAAEALVQALVSLPSLTFHVFWFSVWVLWNSGVTGIDPFDEFPFSLLTMIVSLEAIFLTMFVLRAEVRQSAAQSRREKMDLQINVLAEQEITKLMHLVSEIHAQVTPGDAQDPEVEEMSRKTQLDSVAAAVDDGD